MVLYESLTSGKQVNLGAGVVCVGGGGEGAQSMPAALGKSWTSGKQIQVWGGGEGGGGTSLSADGSVRVFDLRQADSYAEFRGARRCLYLRATLIRVILSSRSL